MFEMFKARKARKAEMERISKFREDLANMGECPYKDEQIFNYSLEFFKLVASFQDEGLLQYSKCQQEQKLFNGLLKAVGRDEFGTNRTQPGEDVTLDSIYLGNIFGLVTRTARVWKSDKEIYHGFGKRWLKSNHLDSNPTMSHVIATHQLQPLVVSARRGLMDLSMKLAR